CGSEFCSRTAQRMAESDGAAIGIDARRIKARLLKDGEGLRGKGFIKLDDGDVVERQTGKLQSFGNGEDGADAKFFWGTAGGGVGEEGGRGWGPQGFGPGR